MSHTNLGTISKVTLSAVAICLALSTNSAHAAEGITVDLVQETYDSSLEHSLFVGSVTRSGKPTADTAVCLAAFMPGKRPVPCQGPQCRVIGMRVADHNVELDGYAHGTSCADPYRIGKRFDMHEVMLADLNAVETPAVDIGVKNIYDNGMMTMEVLADRFRQTCRIPSGDADVRYGLGWAWDGSMSHHYLPSSSLYVCSEGVRVCSFSGDFMEEGFNSVEVRGNDENNTIMLSASSDIAIDGERYCVAAAEAGSGSEHYKVYGWPEEWRAGTCASSAVGVTTGWWVDPPRTRSTAARATTCSAARAGAATSSTARAAATSCTTLWAACATVARRSRTRTVSLMSGCGRPGRTR